MKLHEDLLKDRSVEFETDDEDDQAERDHDDNYESDSLGSSPGHSDNDIDTNPAPWPQSYRQSTDMFSLVTPSCSLKGIGESFMSSIYRRSTVYDLEASQSRPFLSETTMHEDKALSPYLRARISAPSKSRFSICEYPSSRPLCSFSQAVLNGLNCLCGVGLLAIPYAFKGGWSTLLLLLLFAIISCYTGILLKECLQSSPGLQTYPDIGQAAFGFTGRLIVAITLYIQLYASCVGYIIAMSDNLSSMFPETSVSFGVSFLNSRQVFAIITTLVVLPTVWLRDLSLLSYLSAGGVITSVVLVLCLEWVGVINQVGFHPSGTFLDLANFPITLGLCSFCFSGHCVFPNIYSSMEKPRQFPLVMITCFAVCCFLYIGVGASGYLMFGNAVESQYTLSMPKELVASQVAIVTTVVSPLTKYALTFTPIVLSIEELLPSKQRSYLVSMLIRALLVLSTLLVALSVPFFGLLMAFLGSFFSILVSNIFPCACYLSILGHKLSKIQIGICVSVLLAGVACSCIGTNSAISRILNEL
ncbi:Amino acid transporter, transmembrane domain [Dillenia turbinata]|uniref:Amino acid transporter, transmembrane domain n=1 Tax=Dillenia turbinata TaxID=194707 RepID=A0AAN8ZR24_9MAGN